MPQPGVAAPKRALPSSLACRYESLFWDGAYRRRAWPTAGKTSPACVAATQNSYCRCSRRASSASRQARFKVVDGGLGDMRRLQ
jgi:hypothetical protein